jgi:hypothetical protein
MHALRLNRPPTATVAQLAASLVLNMAEAAEAAAQAQEGDLEADAPPGQPGWNPVAIASRGIPGIAVALLGQKYWRGKTLDMKVCVHICKVCEWKCASTGIDRLMRHLLPELTRKSYMETYGHAPDARVLKIFRDKNNSGARARLCTTMLAQQDIVQFAKAGIESCKEFCVFHGIALQAAPAAAVSRGASSGSLLLIEPGVENSLTEEETLLCFLVHSGTPLRSVEDKFLASFLRRVAPDFDQQALKRTAFRRLLQQVADKLHQATFSVSCGGPFVSQLGFRKQYVVDLSGVLSGSSVILSGP